jgi:hypothetical protein
MLMTSMLFSCSSVYKKIDGWNKHQRFDNVNDYVSFFSKKYKVKKEKFFFVQEDQYWPFMEYLQQNNKMNYFYGITLNDSTEIYDPFLNEMSGCTGRISGVITNMDNPENTKESGISNFYFSNLQHSAIDFSKGKSVIFLFGENAGNSVNNSISDFCDEIQSLNDASVNYYIIVIDTPFVYNNKQKS